jgi:hypothetical protein
MAKAIKRIATTLTGFMVTKSGPQLVSRGRPAHQPTSAPQLINPATAKLA